MKFAILFSLSLIVSSVIDTVHGSESAPDCQTAIDTLAAGIEVHPAQAVVLFQDALQTNPDCRSQLLMKAIQLTGAETTILARLIYAARIEFPEDDNLFAEAAMTVAPDCGAEIREAFMKSPDEMGEALAIGSAGMKEEGGTLAGQTTMDEDIREAIARVTAKAEGKHWPEQELSDEPLHFRKPDEIRVSNESGAAEEASLANGLALDKVDERAFSHLPVKIDDAWKPSIAIRLDESKFGTGLRTDSTEPLEAEMRSIAPAGEAKVSEAPVPKQSNVSR
ncbi:MAG: hypothetical protein ABL994_25475, partial [Verrucomicrobiales bacterium]